MKKLAVLVLVWSRQSAGPRRTMWEKMQEHHEEEPVDLAVEATNAD